MYIVVGYYATIPVTWSCEHVPGARVHGHDDFFHCLLIHICVCIKKIRAKRFFFEYIQWKMVGFIEDLQLKEN